MSDSPTPLTQADRVKACTVLASAEAVNQLIDAVTADEGQAFTVGCMAIARRLAAMGTDPERVRVGAAGAGALIDSMAMEFMKAKTNG